MYVAETPLAAVANAACTSRAREPAGSIPVCLRLVLHALPSPDVCELRVEPRPRTRACSGSANRTGLKAAEMGLFFRPLSEKGKSSWAHSWPKRRSHVWLNDANAALLAEAEPILRTTAPDDFDRTIDAAPELQSSTSAPSRTMKLARRRSVARTPSALRTNNGARPAGLVGGGGSQA